MKPGFAKIAAFGLCALPAPAGAQSADDYATVSLRPGWAEQDGTRFAAIEIDLAPGWHTYWRQPGDAGIPPMLDLSNSQNLADVKIHWPVPAAYDQNGLVTLVYFGRAILPLELTPAADGPIALSGRLNIGVCAEICIPAEFDLNARLDGAGAPDPMIADALDNVPLPAASAGHDPARCGTEPISDGLRLTVDVPAEAAKGVEVAIIETGDPTIWVAQSQTRFGAEIYSVSADLVPAEAKPFTLDRSGVRLTLLGETGAIEFVGCAPG